MSDEWLDYLREQDDLNPFTVNELPRRWRDVYSEMQDWEEAA